MENAFWSPQFRQLLTAIQGSIGQLVELALCVQVLQPACYVRMLLQDAPNAHP